MGEGSSVGEIKHRQSLHENKSSRKMLTSRAYVFKLNLNFGKFAVVTNLNVKTGIRYFSHTLA